MTALLLLLVLAAEVAPAPAPAPTPGQVAAWAADLSSPDPDRRHVAAVALVRAGPRAAPAVPALVALLGKTDVRPNDAVGVLTAIGPDAKAAAPALLELLRKGGHSFFTDDLAGALARIDGPNPEATLALLLATGKCTPIVLDVSRHLREYPAQVVPHVVALCGSKDAAVREKAATVLGGLNRPLLPDGRDPRTLLQLAGDGAAGVPAALERLLADESVTVRLTAAAGIAHVAPHLVPKTVPVVVAAVTEQQGGKKGGGFRAADIFRPAPREAAAALVPLFDSDDDQTRWWAINTLAELAAREEVEAVLEGGKTDRAREAAAVCLGSGYADGAAVPALTAALADAEFPVRFAAAHSLARQDRGAAAVPVLVEGLKRAAVREEAVHDLSRIGAAAKAAVPDLKRLLSDKKEEFALEAALALVAIAPAEAADAVPALTRGLAATNGRAGRAAVALGDLGPAAKAVVPDLVKAFGAANPNVRVSAAEAATRIDPAQVGPATEVIVALLRDPKHAEGGVRGHAAEALRRIGPGAKAAVPTLLALLAGEGDRYRPEFALAAVALDPAAAKPAVEWVRNCLAGKVPDADPYELLELLRTAGPAAAPLVPDLAAALGSKTPFFREAAAEALGAVGPGAKEALPRLRGLAGNDPRPDVRKAAAAAVEKIERK